VEVTKKLVPSPQVVDVMGVEFGVEWVPGLSFEIPEEDGEALRVSGSVDYEKQSIVAARDGSEYTKRVVLLHEILHAILHIAGQPDDEVMVRALGYSLLYVLRHNPGLVKFLLEDPV
jgi:hypothetical protein